MTQLILTDARPVSRWPGGHHFCVGLASDKRQHKRLYSTHSVACKDCGFNSFSGDNRKILGHHTKSSLRCWFMLTSFSEQTQTEAVRARHTIIWTGQHYTYREQFKEVDKEADRGNDGKTTSKSGLALNGISYYRKLRTTRSGGSWL